MKIQPCTHRPTCPGCPRYGEASLAASCEDLLHAIAAAHGAALDEVVEGAALGFRVRARLAVRGRAASPKIGIFQEGTHRIADIPSCGVHHPRINETARVLREALRRCAVAPYADAAHRGLLRYVQIVVERSTGRVQLVLVANDDSEASLLPLAEDLRARLGERLQGLWWNGNSERGNAIFGAKWKLLAGEEALRETIGGASVFFPPGAFGQSNLDLADRIVAELHARVADGATVAEFHCGVGAIGLGLVARSRELRFNEVNAQGLGGLELGIEALGEELRAKTRVIGGEAAAAATAMLEGASVAIVDPPRKGLERGLVQGLRASRAGRLLYVSCDPESLKRDAALLCDAGRMRLRRLTPYALFPYTDHVETLADFDAT